jgi:hypothetical protein
MPQKIEISSLASKAGLDKASKASDLKIMPFGGPDLADRA